MKVFSAGPFISKNNAKFIAQAYKSGWYSKMNYYHDLAEKKMKNIFKKKYCILFSSCTGAMDVLIRSLNLKKNDEIIVPETTWIGTISGLCNQGLKPVFVDVNLFDGNINTNKILEKLNKNTRAIISVDCYGNPSNKKSIKKICKKNNLFFLEDAAPGFGSKISKKFCGTFGDAGVFSFQGAKPITSGEGGALITNNKKIYEKALYFSDHCRDNKYILYNTNIGYKYKMSNLQAAMLYTQLKDYKKIIKKRREIFNNYTKKLSKNKNFYFLNCKKKSEFNNYYVPTLILKKNSSAKKLISFLKSKNIDSRPVFRPLSSLPMFKNQRKENPNSYYLFKYGLNLPTYGQMSKKEINYVCRNIKKYFDTN